MSLLAASKLIVMLVVSILIQFCVCFNGCFSMIGHMAVEQFVTKLLLCIATGIMVWVASLPCIALIIVFNRNYIFLSCVPFICTYGFYCYQCDNSDRSTKYFMILPVNTINRWLLPFFQNLDTAKYPFDIGPSSVNAIICVVYLFVYALVFGWIICNRFKKWDN